MSRRAGSQITSTRQDVAFALRLVQLLAGAQAELCHSKTTGEHTRSLPRAVACIRAAHGRVARRTAEFIMCAESIFKNVTLVDDATHN